LDDRPEGISELSSELSSTLLREWLCTLGKHGLLLVELSCSDAGATVSKITHRLIEPWR
jgi:hypothetical protein